MPWPVVFFQPYAHAAPTSARSSSSTTDVVAHAEACPATAVSASQPPPLTPPPLTPPPLTPPPPAWRGRWAVLAISCTGILLSSVSTSALVVAFPRLSEDLNVPLNSMLWVLLSVMVVICATAQIAGKLGDAFGQARLYTCGFALFTLGCLLSGFSSPSAAGADLIGYRVLTGVGAAVLFVNSGAILADAFAPYHQVGLAQGAFQATLSAGVVLGPVVGGVLAVIDWRWLFFVNVPVGVVCTAAALCVVRDARSRPRRAQAPACRAHARAAA